MNKLKKSQVVLFSLMFQEEEEHISGTTGYYCGNIVFIRKYKIKNFDLHSKHIQEMRQVCSL